MPNLPLEERPTEFFAFAIFMIDMYQAGLVTKRQVGVALSPVADTELFKQSGDLVMIGCLVEGLDLEGNLIVSAKSTDTSMDQLALILKK